MTNIDELKKWVDENDTNGRAFSNYNEKGQLRSIKIGSYTFTHFGDIEHTTNFGCGALVTRLNNDCMLSNKDLIAFIRLFKLLGKDHTNG